MTVLRLIAAAIAGWLLWGWLAGRIGAGSDRSQSPGGDRDEPYRGLTDQPIEDAEYEDISRK